MTEELEGEPSDANRVVILISDASAHDDSISERHVRERIERMPFELRIAELAKSIGGAPSEP